MKVMLAVDGSSHSLDAARCLVDQVARYREPPEIEGGTTRTRARRRSRRRASCSTGRAFPTKEERFDLICLGTRAKWIGSTATEVIHQSEVPVLVVK